MIEKQDIGALVAALPEKYQPIFGHPELSEGSSRGCEDRLALISKAAERLKTALGRPLRVLDLGCAQGFFSLSLAAQGHRVHGVDFLDKNIEVCQGLALSNTEFDASFEHATVEDVINRLEPGEYDLVLGLSVFHHIVHATGIISVVELCRKLSEVTSVGIYELALKEEPLYWAPSLPGDPAELLSSYAFTRLLSRQATHLSRISRPLYFASSRFWYVDQSVGEFISWSGESHAHGRGTHRSSRRYYLGARVFVKKMTLGIGGRAEINLQEFHNELKFLQEPPEAFPAPRLIAAQNDESDLFLARELFEGRLLSELIDDGSSYDGDRVLSDLLEQLVALERADLYHNDVRCWNVLISTEGRALLIDYGAISSKAEDCSWLEDLLFSFLITTKEILQRAIVSSSPSREPLLGLESLPPRYRNAFIRLFGQEQSNWTFVELQDCLANSSDDDAPLPGWSTLYQRLQRALQSYNKHLDALYAQAEHQRVELAARSESLERSRELASQSQDALVEVQLKLGQAEERYQILERNCAELTEWAKSLETSAIEYDGANQRLAAHAAELEAGNAALLVEVEARQKEVNEREHLRRTAELLASDLERMNAQSDDLQAKLSESRRHTDQLQQEIDHLKSRLVESEHLSELQKGEIAALRDELSQSQHGAQQYKSRVEELQAKAASFLQRIERFESSRAHDRRRLKELQLDLSQGQEAAASSRDRIRELEMAVEVLEQQVAGVYRSRSWRITAPLRWLTTKLSRREKALLDFPGGILKENNKISDGTAISPADAIVDRKLAALDQIASRVRVLSK